MERRTDSAVGDRLLWHDEIYRLPVRTQNALVGGAVKLFLLLAATCLLQAESVHSLLPTPGKTKLSDGLLLCWNLTPADRSQDSLEAFDRSGSRLLGINVYQLLPFAEKISIADVAARRNDGFAIAAVTVEHEGRENQQNRPWLLRLDASGRLLWKKELSAAEELGWLDFDKSGAIWGLTDYEGEQIRKGTIEDGIPCPVGPLILAFDSEGKKVKSILKQIDFRPGFSESASTGQVSFGITGDQVWFWQPAKNRMVIADLDGRNVRKFSLPRQRTYNLGGLTALTPAGEVIQDLHSPTPAVRGIYLARNRRVEKISRLNDDSFVGMDGSEFVFIRPGKTAAEFELVRIPSVTELRDQTWPQQQGTR